MPEVLTAPQVLTGDRAVAGGAFHVVDSLRDTVAGADGDVAPVAADQQAGVVASGDNQGGGHTAGRVALA